MKKIARLTVAAALVTSLVLSPAALADPCGSKCMRVAPPIPVEEPTPTPAPAPVETTAQ